ncbi:MAG: hypothetical protein KF764_16150 [Labilithrix sp.]|nr:hypothetical protein [Labilithrix sp.]
MRHILGTVGVLVALAFLGGCASQPTRARAPADVFGAMNAELSRSLTKGDAFDAMNDELAHAIGTTTLASAVVLGPMPLPESRLSLAAETRALQTWGVAEAELEEPAESELVSGIDPGGIPDTRE